MMNIATRRDSSFITHHSSFREWRAEPRLVVAPLLLGRTGKGHDAVGGGGAPAEPDVEGAQLVAAEDRERQLVAGALVGHARFEKVARGAPPVLGGGVAPDAEAVHGDDLVPGAETLLVGGRARGDGLDDERARRGRPS